MQAQALLEKNGRKEVLVDSVETDSLSVRTCRVSTQRCWCGSDPHAAENDALWWLQTQSFQHHSFNGDF